MAIALTATMVLGSSLTAFADDNTGNSTGAGTSEGHVEKKATNVVLPTSVADSTFAYTMDPERLIVETSHEKYGDAVEFPASNDTGVYFNNGPKGGDGTDKDNVVYANTSKALDVVNKSSHSINLTVKAEAVAGDNDIPLVAKNAIASAENASLYLGLVVGSEDAAAIAADTAATKTVSIAGTAGNFKTAVKTVEGNKTYEYRALTADEWKAGLADDNENKNKTGDALTAAYDATWAKTSFNIEGSVTSGKAITSTTTAPSVKVTWSWVDPDANVAPSVTGSSFAMTAGENVSIPVNLGLGTLAATGVASAIWNGDDLYGSTVTYANNVITMASGAVDYLIANPSAPRTLKIVFNDDAHTEVTVEFTTE
jgi:hypothetical protein